MYCSILATTPSLTACLSSSEKNHPVQVPLVLRLYPPICVIRGGSLIDSGTVTVALIKPHIEPKSPVLKCHVTSPNGIGLYAITKG